MWQRDSFFVTWRACLYSRNTGEDGLRYIAGDRSSHGDAHDKGCSGRGQVCARGPVDGDAAGHKRLEQGLHAKAYVDLAAQDIGGQTERTVDHKHGRDLEGVHAEDLLKIGVT